MPSPATSNLRLIFTILMVAIVYSLSNTQGHVICMTILTTLPFASRFAKKFNRMLRSNCPVPAAKVVGGTVLITSPTDSLRMLRIEHFRFRHANC